MNWSPIIEHIGTITNQTQSYVSSTSVSGGSINQSYRLTTSEKNLYFVKLNHLQYEEMFAAEYEALIELQKAHELHCPRPICYGSFEHQSYIVMEYIDLSHKGNHYQLGQALANMHRITAQRYGWTRNNTIGSTPQYNTLSYSWSEFWLNQRLLPQLEMIFNKGYRSLLEQNSTILINNIEHFFANYQPEASLLHGDLWSGNYAFDHDGKAVIYDPAIYYGDRETDLAMTELFGGFTQDFYRGYQENYPLADSYKIRKNMYNLYHILNHGNLFGSSYVTQAGHMINQLIKGL